MKAGRSFHHDSDKLEWSINNLPLCSTQAARDTLVSTLLMNTLSEFKPPQTSDSSNVSHEKAKERLAPLLVDCSRLRTNKKSGLNYGWLDSVYKKVCASDALAAGSAETTL